jgi:hypothetical protein
VQDTSGLGRVSKKCKILLFLKKKKQKDFCFRAMLDMKVWRPGCTDAG